MSKKDESKPISRRRYLKYAAAAAVAAAAVAGGAYYGTMPPPKATETATATATPTATATATPTATATGLPEVPVRIGFSAVAASDALNVEFYKKFVEMHPNVAVDYYSWPGSSYYEKMSSVMMVSPELVDIVCVDWGYSRNYYKAGWTTEIDPLPGALEYKNTLVDSAQVLFTLEGKFLGVPCFMGEYSSFWNPSAFAKVGVTEPPKTWVEILEALVEMKKRHMYKYGLAALFSSSVWWGPHIDWAMLAANYGGKETRLFGPPPTYEPLFLSEDTPGYKAMKLLVDFKQKYNVLDPASFEIAGSGSVCQLGMADLAPLVVRAQGWNLIGNLNNPKTSGTAGKWDWLPAPEGGVFLAQGQYFGPSKYLMTKKDEATQKWTWELLKYIGSYEYQKKYSLTNGMSPAFKAEWDDPDIKNFFSTKGTFDTFKNMATQCVPITVVNNVIDSAFFVDWRFESSIAIQKAIMGKTTLDHCLNYLAEFTAGLAKKYA